MSALVAELYDALRKAGVDDDLAKRAANAVLPAEARTELATKTDLAELKAELKADMAELKVSLAELKADVIKWNVGAMAVMTGIFAAISRL